MYPRQPPHTTGTLDLDGQSVYWEESGNPDGIPVVYLHGGPGGGLGAGGYRDKLDPSRYRIIGLDQRGCGRSVPLVGEAAHDLSANTTGTLIADLEALRRRLQVEAWLLNGVSWGSTLALAYAQEHPDRTLGIVLMAVTSTRRAEVDWISEGCRILYPEAWDRLARVLERVADYRRDGAERTIDAVARVLGDLDHPAHGEVVRAWGEWENWHISIGAGGYQEDPRWQDPRWAVPFAVLVTHYWSNDGFLDPPILERMPRIAHLPAVLIHGRLDVSGPVDTAWLLHRQWPASELIVVEDEGHGGPAMVQHWREANDRMADLLAR